MLVMIDSKKSRGPGDLLVGEIYLEVSGKALDSRRAWRRSWSGQGRGSWREEERDGGSGGSPASGAEVEEGRPSHRWWGTFGIVVSQAVGHIPQPHNPHLSLYHTTVSSLSKGCVGTGLVPVHKTRVELLRPAGSGHCVQLQPNTSSPPPPPEPLITYTFAQIWNQIFGRERS